MKFAQTAQQPLETADTIRQRQSDWRCGAVVYQVLVDRFAPSENLDAKRPLYAAPKKLRRWDESPTRGSFLHEHAVWSHEVDFWGGDLKSLIGRIDYLHQLGADCVYLNPIHESFTNHKYGAINYRRVSPEYGTCDDLRRLAQSLHDRQMRLMLDGVFNHVGLRSEIFQSAQADPSSPRRDWFDFNEKYQYGFRTWHNVPNLPELNLDSLPLRQELWLDDDSVVASYLKDGADGWRLDVAFDLGPEYLNELTHSARRIKPDAWIIGETWTYPSGWVSVMDGVMNFSFRQLVLHLLADKLSGAQAGRILAEQTVDAGVEGLLRSWLILDNHDTPRLKTVLPRRKHRRFAQALQFTSPGCPCIYYGVEVGMTGGDDPEMRGPMAWDKVNEQNADLRFMGRLLELRRCSPALRFGSVRYLSSDKLLAFVRYTDRTFDSVIVAANPSEEPITEVLSPRIPWLLSYTELADELSSFKTQVHSGLVEVRVPSKSVLVLKPQRPTNQGYDPNKRLP